MYRKRSREYVSSIFYLGPEVLGMSIKQRIYMIGPEACLSWEIIPRGKKLDKMSSSNKNKILEAEM